MRNLQKNIQLLLEFHKALFLVLHFSYYTLLTFLIMLCVNPNFLKRIFFFITSNKQKCPLWLCIWFEYVMFLFFIFPWMWALSGEIHKWLTCETLELVTLCIKWIFFFLWLGGLSKVLKMGTVNNIWDYQKLRF